MTLWILAAEPSSWEFSWEALVAIGTLVLALATGALALSTRNLSAKTAEEVEHSRRQVDASLEQVRVAQEQATAAQEALATAQEQTRISQLTLDAQIRPVLIDVPLDLAIEQPLFYPGRDEPVTGHRGAVHVGAGDREVVVSLPLRNAGAGLAMIRGVGIRLAVASPTPPVMIQPANMPPGEDGRITFRATPGDAAFAPLSQAIQARQSLSIEVGYSDLTGQQYTLSRFDVYFRSRAHWNWEVRQVHLQEPGAGEPFAGSAPTA